MNLTTLAAVVSGLATVCLLTAFGTILLIWNDATEFYDGQMDELSQFKHYSNDAWTMLVLRAPPTASRKVSSTAGRSPFLSRKKRSAYDDVCSCVESAHLCPPGPRGEPGLPGIPGSSGEKGSPGAPGIDYVVIFRDSPKNEYGQNEPKRCFTCPAGKPGRMGADGPPGLPGRPGTPGRRGVPGRHGLKGEKGEMGDQGPPGKAGKPGNKGHPGQNGIKGKGLRGVPGPRGIGGPRGKPGKNGIIGIPGKHGNMGPKGPEGKVGPSGKDGAVGPEGYPGPPGKDSDYCFCPERKDKTIDNKGTTAVPYFLTAGGEPNNNYQRREIPTQPPVDTISRTDSVKSVVKHNSSPTRRTSKRRTTSHPKVPEFVPFPQFGRV